MRISQKHIHIKVGGASNYTQGFGVREHTLGGQIVHVQAPTQRVGSAYTTKGVGSAKRTFGGEVSMLIQGSGVPSPDAIQGCCMTSCTFYDRARGTLRACYNR